MVEGLRKNLENKQLCPNSNSSNTPGFSASSVSSTPQTSTQEIRMVCCTQKCPVANHKIQTTVIYTVVLYIWNIGSSSMF